MKYFVSMAVLSMLFCGAQAAQTARPTMVGKMVGAAPRYTASINQLNGLGGVSTSSNSSTSNVVDNREAERNACINNNIGVGNTFVWASQYSDTSSYASMTEDIDNPQNNVCFVRVELRSDDSRISLSDVPAKYFKWGENIECGSWANEKEMEQRILDAKKGARVGGIVASTVGGAGLGVGIMEAFGNKLIGHGLDGQKEMSSEELYISMLHVYENDKSRETEFKNIVSALEVLKRNNVNKVDKVDISGLIKEFANK